MAEKKEFTKLAYSSVDDFLYGVSPFPVKTENGLEIGGGLVYPEVNFTLPGMAVTKDTMPEVLTIYKEIIDGVLQKALDLHQPGLVIEYETLPQMSEFPQFGIDIHKLLRDAMFEYEAKYGLKSAMRMTPNDLREINRPMILRGGEIVDNMFHMFRQSALDGADFLAIESTGGKEINDEAIMNADIRTAIFALGCMAPRDMAWLWQNISDIARETGAIPAGDSACGFGNTSMVLAEQGFIPKVFATLMRVATIPRALTALENGAVGPSKDCAYEGIFLKAITGTPIALEGKTAACAHFSPIGNIAAAVADLWSNESVQHIKLLSGFAPVVSTEQLIYDCRLMNVAAKQGHAKLLRDLLVDSDAYLDPQAYILKPDIAFEIAGEIVKTQNQFTRTLNAVRLTLDILRRGIDKKEITLDERESLWLERLSAQIEQVPEDEEEFIEEMKDEIDTDKCDLREYGI
ncbi:MAG: methanol--corrinoid methyltransferase [Candidatus Accumulibacter sp.]|jgi:methanol--5-hydroxybenzimidazolylcobamide Co-methyltransferase|nr:methanol--corrinoid methyltransferase [Accumulibacter sp.]